MGYFTECSEGGRLFRRCYFEEQVPGRILRIVLTGPMLLVIAFSIRKEPVLESAELITSRLTGAGSLLPPVYGEAWSQRARNRNPESTSPGTGRRTRQTCGCLGDVASRTPKVSPEEWKEEKGNWNGKKKGRK
ncbi:hypothetical protein TNCV_3135041 [Trichonephila clavipes]|nr:hypothetical protein TNCV_3135041 [Trichonephila clavipes]